MRTAFSPNPYLSHLIKRKGSIDFLEEFAPLLMWGVVAALAAGTPLALGVITPLRYRQSALVILFIAPLFVPAFVSIFSALQTSTQMRNDTTSLLYLTNLSSHDILWSYIFSNVYRLRKWIMLFVGLTPATALFVGVSGLGLTSNLTSNGCFYSPLGIPHCDLTSTSFSAFFAPLAVICAGTMIHQFGVIVFSTVIGVAVSIRSKGSFIAAFIAAMIILILAAFSWLVYLDEFYLGIFNQITVINMVVLGMVVAWYSTLPYLSSVLLGRYAAKWVRPG